MTAGFNNAGRIWRFTASTNNDEIGGAVPTGTVLYTPVFSRIASERPTLALLEQGLETPEIFRAELSYVAYSPTGTFDVQHNDQYEVMWPPVSPFYQKRFVIIGIQHNSYNDSRRFLRVTMRRIETANSDLLLNSSNQLNFDGVNDTVIIPPASSLNNLPLGNFTVGWAGSFNNFIDEGFIFDKTNIGYEGWQLWFQTPESGTGFTGLSILITSDHYNGVIELRYAIPDLYSHYFEFSWNHSSLSGNFFIDGISQPLVTGSSVGFNISLYDNDSGNPISIASHNAAPTYYYPVITMNWIIISNVILHTTNFTPPSLTVCPVTSDSTTVLRLALDERTGTIVHDSSKNANNGLIVGATWQVTE